MPAYSVRSRANARILCLQLEVLDTAGAEQFLAFNELYIKVRQRRDRRVLSCSVWLTTLRTQSGMGFILVFR